MDAIRSARAVGGLLAIITLLALVSADVLYQAVTLDGTTLAMLLGVISALLGVDMLADRLPVSITVGERDDNGGPDQ